MGFLLARVPELVRRAGRDGEPPAGAGDELLPPDPEADAAAEASLSPDEAQTQERITAYLGAELGAERADELRVEGAAMPLDELLDDVASRS